MKNKKPIKIDRKDFDRVLLTDLLPYETPVIFSNRHFYERIKNDKLKNSFIKEMFKKSKEPSIPYTYHASRGDLGVRELSVIHPRYQIELVGFYSKYYSMILDRCSLSTFSLRSPTRVASRFYERELLKDLDELISDEVDHEENGVSPQSRFSTSFFTYRKYNRLFQFFDSNEFLDIEKKFSRYLSLDVSKCFYNIYTHSIGWAVKDKKFSKSNSTTWSFENKFDVLMRNCNSGETNGILVGPEVSRIFSEIIFQRIDSNVKEKLENQSGARSTTDYIVKRYIDDIYIFTNSPQIEESIRALYQAELSKYKLYLNKSKNKQLKRPFYTNISSSKDTLFYKTDAFFDCALVPVGNGAKILNKNVNFRNLTSTLIAGYKDAASLNGVGYSNISGIFLGIIRKRVLGFSKQMACIIDRDEEYNAISYFYLELIRLIYFVLATDLKSRNVDLAYQSLILLYENLSSYAPVLRQVFTRSTEEGFVDIFLSETNSKNLEENRLEFISSLIVISYISPFFEIPEDSLMSFWEISKTHQRGNFSDSFPYFEAVVLLFYIKERPQFSSLKHSLRTDLEMSIRSDGLAHTTSTFMAFLDFSACPYLDKEAKKSLIEAAWLSIHNIPPKDAAKLQSILTALEEFPWFIDWNTEVLDIRKALFRKELQSVY